MAESQPLVHRRGFWLVVGSIAVCAVLALLALGSAIRGNSAAGTGSGNGGSQNVAGVTSGNAPWPANPPGLQTRLTEAGLPLLSSEGTVLHIHQHLDLYINGQHVSIPADIGIDTATGQLSPIHTHDTTGVIHVESPTVQNFTLGQFFQVWGVSFTSSCIATDCVGDGSILNVWANGQLYSGDPDTLVLQGHQEIVIAYGNPSQMPNPVPSTYDWTGL